MFRGQSKICLWLAAFLFIATTTVASPPWSVRTWLSDEGLPDNTVVGIEQTSDNFLWVATQTGLVRFDGVQFREFPLQAPGVSSRSIQALLVDRQGRLWVATEKGCVVCVEQGVPKVVIALGKDRPEHRVRMLVEDGEGAVWASFITGDLARLTDGTVRFFTCEDGLPAGGLVELAADSGGHLWATKPGWLGVFRDGRFCLKAETPSERLCASRTGGLWLCDKRQFYKYTEAGGLSENRDLPRGGDLVQPTVLYEDRAKRLWIGTRLTGLFCYDGTTISKIDIAQQTILSITEDHEGNIWVGTRGGGLKQLKPRLIELLTTGTSPPIDGIQSICKDKEGQLWAIIWQKGGVIRNVGEQWLPLSDHEGWSVRYARSVVADLKGGVWIGTTYSGLFHWQDGAVTHHFCSTNGLMADCVSALHMTESGVLWIGGEGSVAEKHLLFRLKDGDLREFAMPAGSGLVTAIEVDALGDCWAATVRGSLVRVQGDVLVDETRKMLTEPHPIRALLATPDNSLWIGFAGSGLGRLKEGLFTNYRREQGLHDDYISSILSDRRGRLWLAGNRGISSVSEKALDELASGQRQQVHSVAYKRKDGLISLQASYDAWPGALRDADGHLLFAMQSGVAIVYPEELAEVQKPPSVFIDHVSVNGKVVALYGAWKSLSSRKGPAPHELGRAQPHLRLPPGERQVEFSFTAPSFTMPESVGFKYRLQGVDNDWLEAGARRSVLYSQLAPGHYCFEVAACGRSGVWNKTSAAVELTVVPYWWEMAWFRVGGPLIAVGLLVGWFILDLRRRHRHQLERLELQEATEKERMRISRDLHDDLGAGLTQISLVNALMQTDAPEAEKGAASSKVNELTLDLVRSLDEIVWAVRPQNDNLPSLVEYLANVGRGLCEDSAVRCWVSVLPTVPELEVSASVRHNLLMAFREAVNNVLKHAGATELHIRLRLEAGEFTVEIVDNGCGFDVAKGEAKCSGLLHIRQRLTEVGGRCEMSSVSGQGTTVRLSFPLAAAARSAKDTGEKKSECRSQESECRS